MTDALRVLSGPGRCVAIACLLATALSAGAAAGGKPSPTDLDWLRKACGDGALAYQSEGSIRLTELSTGKTQRIGNGERPEFSPDSSKLAWVDGRAVKGRMRKGDPAIHVIATDVDSAGGVHWLGNDELVVLKRKGGWHRVKLGGGQTPVPELNKLGAGGRECDVKLGADGIWSYTCGTTWRTSDGKRGKTGGHCSCSLSPDGKSVTGLHKDHRSCSLTRIRPGGVSGILKWKYQHKGSDGFDNQRWSSNDLRFIVSQDEFANCMVIGMVGSTDCTRMGEPGGGEMYGDFTVGDGKGAPWPTKGDHASSSDPKGAWPVDRSGLAFLWDNGAASNTISAAPGKPGRVCKLTRVGAARLGRHFEMDPRGGTFYVDPESVRALSQATRDAGGVTIELLVTLAPRTVQSVPWLKLCDAAGKELLRFDQRGDRVGVSLPGGGAAAVSDDVAPDRPHHMALSCGPNGDQHEARLYVDGTLAAHRDLPAGGMAKWTIDSMSFGGKRWTGRIEAVAVFARALDAEQVKRNRQVHKHRLADRRSPKHLVVQATLLKTTPLPPASAYPNALVVYRYRVGKVIHGKYKPGLLIVAHHGVLNGKPQPAVRDREVGRGYRLTLEPFADHPQLKTLKRVEVDDDDVLALPLFHDVE